MQILIHPISYEATTIFNTYLKEPGSSYVVQDVCIQWIRLNFLKA